MLDLLGLLQLLWQGFELIGEALMGLITFLLGLLGIVLPDWIPELGTIGILLIVVFKYGKFLGKILLTILLLLLASTLIQLLL